MKKMLMLAFFLFTTYSAFAQESVKISGYIFGDYANKIGGSTSALAVSKTQYSAWNKADQQFQFRRLYLSTDYNINENFATQLLIEANDGTYSIGNASTTATPSAGPFKSGFFVKRAFLEWKNLVPMASLYFGLISTPTFDQTSEKEWNYRSVEKTIADARGLAPSSDMGIGIRGKLDGTGMFSYNVMVANGAGQSPETDKYKRVYGSFTVRPIKDLTLDIYGDYTDAANQKLISTSKVFGAYKLSDVHLGAEYVMQHQGNSYASGGFNHDKNVQGFSAFAWTPIVKELNIFGRFDTYNPDADNTISGAKETFMTFGLDFMPDAKVHIIPNIWINSFKDKSAASISKDADVVARLTFHFIFK